MKIDRRLLNIKFFVEDIADEPIQNTQYIVGKNPTGAFTGATQNSIAYYDGGKWNFILPDNNRIEVFNVATKKFLRWDGEAWSSISTSNLFYPLTYFHILTQEEINNKVFTIEGLGISEQYEYVGLFLNGVLQKLDTDFSFSGFKFSSSFAGERFFFIPQEKNSGTLSKIGVISINWKNGWNALDIRANDVVTLQLSAININ